MTKELRQFTILITFLIMLITVFPGPSFALVITSPPNGSTFNEGDAITIRVEPSPGDPPFRKVVIFTPGESDMCPTFTRPPYECQVRLPEGSWREGTIGAVGRTLSGQFFEAEKVTIYMRVTATLQRLTTLTNQKTFFVDVGGKKRLSIFGEYSDGIDRELDGQAAGTTYESSDPEIATVDAGGLVTGVSPGQAVITAKNGEFQIQVKFIVRN